jgi:hypothetical protein
MSPKVRVAVDEQKLDEAVKMAIQATSGKGMTVDEMLRRAWPAVKSLSARGYAAREIATMLIYPGGQKTSGRAVSIGVKTLAGLISARLSRRRATNRGAAAKPAAATPAGPVVGSTAGPIAGPSAVQPPGSSPSAPPPRRRNAALSQRY